MLNEVQSLLQKQAIEYTGQSTCLGYFEYIFEASSEWHASSCVNYGTQGLCVQVTLEVLQYVGLCLLPYIDD